MDGEITTYAKSKASEIAAYVTALDRDLTVEEIQDIVEAKAYVFQQERCCESICNL